jgi:NADPH-dependent glutamate synthase beta subunit-like oxidoreductase
VVVGNGNVALDVARILLADPDTLARTNIADHGLKALRASSVREVVLLGRRGPEDAAYTTPELSRSSTCRACNCSWTTTIPVSARPSTRPVRTTRPPS